MQITFVVPKDGVGPLSQFAQCRVLPPVGLRRMAGLAGKHATVKLVDERMESKCNGYRTDIAVLFINSYNRERCLALVKRYREAGSYVVLSGPILSNDALAPGKDADSLLVGYGEDCFSQFLTDYKNGKAKAYYHSAAIVTAANVSSVHQLWSLAS